MPYAPYDMNDVEEEDNSSVLDNLGLMQSLMK